MGTDEYNKKAYDQILLRFPKGTKEKYHKLFKHDISFNSWVVSLVTCHLLKAEKWFSDDTDM